jgi:ascorbate-specific PTS system EIIC-type component UlaA
MEFLLTPVPHVSLAGDPLKQFAANAVIYGMTLGLLGCFIWLGWLFWTDREDNS